MSETDRFNIMTNRPLRVLLVGNRIEDATRILEEVARAGFMVTHHQVATADELGNALEQTFDVVLAQHHPTESDGLQALRTLHGHGVNIPLILISTAQDEAQMIEAIKAGASDYVTTNRLDRLGGAVTRAVVLEHQRALLDLASLEKCDFATALETILKKDAETLKIDRVSFWSLREHSISCEFSYGKENNAGESGHPLELSDFPAYFAALRSNSVIAAEMAQEDPRTCEFTEKYLKPNGITSTLDIPVWAGGKLAGIVCHEHRGVPRGWSVEDQKFAASISHMIALALSERERQTAEFALRESEERFRATFEQAAVGIGHLSLAGSWIWVNQRLCTKLGFTREQLLARKWSDLTHTEDHAKTAEGLRQLVADEIEIYSADQRYLRGDGEAIWVNVSLSLKRAPNGEPMYFIGFVQDISDRRRAEDRVLEQANLLDLTHDAIIVRDLEDRILFWNHGAEKLYDISGLSAIGQKESKLLYADTWDFENAKDEVLSRGEWHGELRQCVPGGREVVVDARWTLVRDDGGRAKSILAINTDITSRKALEEQFLRAQRMESIGTLASGVAHDLNNILAPILMAVPMLRASLPENVRESLLATIETSAQRGAEIVRQVLTFARGVEGERVLLQPAHLLREMEKIASETFPKSIAIRNQTPRDLWPVMGDATQLHQVLMNLCVNARDAMVDGGTLTLDAENFRMDESYAAMMPDARVGPYAILKVGDTGSGIPRDIVDKIFDPFFTTKEQGKGTGLGLSTVVGIVRSHGGFLKVTSELGRGTTFHVYLPASVGAEVTAAEEKAPALLQGEGQLVLVVDDEAGIREVTEAVLRRHNYKVLVAADGTEALAAYAQRANEISLVVTDVVMPYIDGVALTRALRKLNPNLKIIAATGHTQNHRAAELKSLDIQGFLHKPFSAEALLKAVHGALKTE